MAQFLSDGLLIWAQVMTSGSWMELHQTPCSAGSLLEILAVCPPPHSISLS